MDTEGGTDVSGARAVHSCQPARHAVVALAIPGQLPIHPAEHLDRVCCIRPACTGILLHITGLDWFSECSSCSSVLWFFDAWLL